MLSIHSVPTEVSNGYLMKPHFPNTKFKCAAYIKIILYRQRGKISAEMRFHVSSHDVYEKFPNLFLFLSSPHKQPINQILFFCSHSTAVNTNRSQIHISIYLNKKTFCNPCYHGKINMNQQIYGEIFLRNSNETYLISNF